MKVQKKKRKWVCASISNCVQELVFERLDHWGAALLWGMTIVTDLQEQETLASHESSIAEL